MGSYMSMMRTTSTNISRIDSCLEIQLTQHLTMPLMPSSHAMPSPTTTSCSSYVLSGAACNMAACTMDAGGVCRTSRSSVCDAGRALETLRRRRWVSEESSLPRLPPLLVV